MKIRSKSVSLYAKIDGRNTTFSLDDMLYDLLAISLKQVPNTKESRIAVRKYIMRQFEERASFDPYLPISRQARKYAMEAIVRPSILEKYWAWRLGDE